MNKYQKNLVEKMVKMDFETGITENDYDEVMSLMEEDENLAPVADEATDYYFELLDMGPAGFYEEFPELDWDEDYVNQYSEDNCDEEMREMRDMRNIRSLRECGNCDCFAELKSVLDSRDIRYSIENFDEGSEMFVSIAEGYTDEISLEISCENGEYVTLINCDSDRTINGPKRMHFSSAIEVANYIDDLIVQYNDFYLA